MQTSGTGGGGVGRRALLRRAGAAMAIIATAGCANPFGDGGGGNGDDGDGGGDEGENGGSEDGGGEDGGGED